jgi:hypothetical protein
MLNVESNTGNKQLDPRPPPPLESKPRLTQTSPTTSNLPTISIFVTNNAVDLNSDPSDAQYSDPSASTSILNKCHSMMNMKPGGAAAGLLSSDSNNRIKLNTENFCLLDAKLKTNPGMMLSYEIARSNKSSRGGVPGAYRKSLSRVNLNMYHLQQVKSADVKKSSSQLNDPSGDESKYMPGNKKFSIQEKSMLLCTSVGGQFFNKSMSNISNTNNNGGGGNLNGNGARKSSNLTTGLYLNPSINQSNESGSCFFKRAPSRADIFKSSTSLNALYLELFDSVSVGSFDRQSFNSCGANSEIELSNVGYNNFNSRYRSTASGRNSVSLWDQNNNDEAAAGVDDEPPRKDTSSFHKEFSLMKLNAVVPTSSSSSVKCSSKVINWLNDN